MKPKTKEEILLYNIKCILENSIIEYENEHGNFERWINPDDVMEEIKQEINENKKPGIGKIFQNTSRKIVTESFKVSGNPSWNPEERIQIYKIGSTSGPESKYGFHVFNLDKNNYYYETSFVTQIFMLNNYFTEIS